LPGDVTSKGSLSGRLFVGLLLLRLLLVLPCLLLEFPDTDLALFRMVARRRVLLFFPGVVGAAPGHVLVSGFHEDLASDG
jgi:uncharacterized membrane protein